MLCLAMIKREVIQLRVTPEEKAQLKGLAERAGESVSSYILGRLLCNDKVLKEFAHKFPVEAPKPSVVMTNVMTSETTEAVPSRNLDTNSQQPRQEFVSKNPERLSLQVSDDVPSKPCRYCGMPTLVTAVTCPSCRKLSPLGI